MSYVLEPLRDVAGHRVAALSRQWVGGTRLLRSVSISGFKRPEAVVFAAPGGAFAVDLTGSDVPMAGLLARCPELGAWLSAS